MNTESSLAQSPPDKIKGPHHALSCLNLPLQPHQAPFSPYSLCPGAPSLLPSPVDHLAHVFLARLTLGMTLWEKAFYVCKSRLGHFPFVTYITLEITFSIFCHCIKIIISLRPRACSSLYVPMIWLYYSSDV